MAVVIEFETPEGFILDDPVQGVLDSVFGLGGDDVFSDISNKSINATLNRGKSRDLDRYSAGTLTVELNNQDRSFDPNYADGPYYRQIVPRRKIRVTTDGVRQFSGVIDDWNFSYEPGGVSKAEIQATDEFTALARQLIAGTPTAQTSGARVTSILDLAAVNWPADRRDISTGSSELGAYAYDSNALEYLQLVEASEQGALFIAKDGDLTFKSSSSAAPKSDGLVTFADDGTGIPYRTVTVEYGTELLVNSVTVTSEAGSSTAQNSTSIQKYGVLAEDIDTLLDSTTQLANLANYTVAKYGEPEYRFSGIVMNLDTMTAPNRAAVLGLELGNVVLVKFTPNDLGDPISQYGQIIKLDQEIQKDRHDFVIGLASLEFTSLVLDDAVFGTLGSNSLAF